MFEPTAQEDREDWLYWRMHDDMVERRKEIEEKFNKHFDTYLGRFMAITMAGGAIRNWDDNTSLAREMWEAFGLDLSDAYSVVGKIKDYQQIWERRNLNDYEPD